MQRFLLALAFSFWAAVPALAQDSIELPGVYLGIFGGTTYLFDQELEDGVTETEIEYDNPSFGFGGLVGYTLDTNVRIEAEMSYVKSDGELSVEVLNQQIADESYDFWAFTATAGLFLDLWPIGSYVPYVGGGLGYARVENEVNGIEDQQSAFTAFGEGGIPIQLTPEVFLIPSARFTWIATEEDDDEIFAKNLYGTHLRLGLRYAF